MIFDFPVSDTLGSFLIDHCFCDGVLVGIVAIVGAGLGIK